MNWLRRRRPPTVPGRPTVTPTGTRLYGDGGTIHSNGEVNVELHNGKVVAVWFRCSTLPFTQREVDAARARDMSDSSAESQPLVGVVFRGEMPRGLGDAASTPLAAGRDYHDS